MRGTNTTRVGNIDKEVIVERISKVANELGVANDNITFIEKMITLSILLSMYDQPLSAIVRAIDEKAQDPSYFVATYFDTKDLDHSLWVYRLVRLLARYILLSDRFFEIGDHRYALLAKGVRKSINEFLLNGRAKHQLKYSIDYSLNQFWPFWRFERNIKRRIIEGYNFSYNEIRHFNLFKSSDASIIYAKVLDDNLPSFTENVSLILHYNQAFFDIKDDWEDIEDDVQEDMPNVFVMAAVEDTPYQRIKNSSHERIRNIIVDGSDSSCASVIRLVNEYESSIRNISIPNDLLFLKSLSYYHVESLREMITSSTNSQ
jgi:hypothetical protein